MSAALAVADQQPAGAGTPEHVSTASLQARFPGWVIWRGEATGSWWAAPPRGYAGRLVEAPDPAELAATIRTHKPTTQTRNTRWR